MLFDDRQFPRVRAIGTPKRADSVATRRSHAAAIASPPPTQAPRTAATVGTSTFSRRSMIRVNLASYATPSAPEAESSNCAMSVPATNAFRRPRAGRRP